MKKYSDFGFEESWKFINFLYIKKIKDKQTFTIIFAQ